jgi:hypothetical protein
VILIILCAVVLYFINRAQGGNVPNVRRLPALDTIDEAIGRATEMGRPVHIANGGSPLRTGGSRAAETIAGLNVLSYVARRCAEIDTKLIVTNQNPEILPLQIDLVRSAYIAAGNPNFSEDMIRFLSTSVIAYAYGVLGIFQRERPAANFLIGSMGLDTIIVLEAAHWIPGGCISVGGAANQWRLQDFFVAANDFFIGEEIFALSAYLTKEPRTLGSMAGQDVNRLLVLALLAIGLIAQLTGFSILNLLST